jgi:hypothetical protein
LAEQFDDDDDIKKFIEPSDEEFDEMASKFEKSVVEALTYVRTSSGTISKNSEKLWGQFRETFDLTKDYQDVVKLVKHNLSKYNSDYVNEGRDAVIDSISRDFESFKSLKETESKLKGAKRQRLDVDLSTVS